MHRHTVEQKEIQHFANSKNMRAAIFLRWPLTKNKLNAASAWSVGRSIDRLINQKNKRMNGWMGEWMNEWIALLIDIISTSIFNWFSYICTHTHNQLNFHVYFIRSWTTNWHRCQQSIRSVLAIAQWHIHTLAYANIAWGLIACRSVLVYSFILIFAAQLFTYS